MLRFQQATPAGDTHHPSTRVPSKHAHTQTTHTTLAPTAAVNCKPTTSTPRGSQPLCLACGSAQAALGLLTRSSCCVRGRLPAQLRAESAPSSVAAGWAYWLYVPDVLGILHNRPVTAELAAACCIQNGALRPLSNVTVALWGMNGGGGGGGSSRADRG